MMCKSQIHERTQEDYPTSAKKLSRCRVVFMHSFISGSFLYFYHVHLCLKWSLTEPFSLVSALSWGFLNQLPNRTRAAHVHIWCYHTADKHVLCWRPTLLAVETNELKMCVQTLHVGTHAHKQLAFQTDLMRRWLLLTGTHLQNGRYHALVLNSGYTTSASYINTIAFAAGLNGLQVHQVGRENDKQTFTYTQLGPSKFNSFHPAVAHTFSSPFVAWLYVPRAQLFHEKPKKCPNKMALHFGDNFEAITR